MATDAKRRYKVLSPVRVDGKIRKPGDGVYVELEKEAGEELVAIDALKDVGPAKGTDSKSGSSKSTSSKGSDGEGK